MIRTAKFAAIIAACLLSGGSGAATVPSPEKIALGREGGTEQPALPDPLSAGWEGAPVCERLHEDSVQRILRCTFPPTVGHERHFHAPYFGYAIVGGRMRITDESGVRELDLATGSSFSNDGVPWHEVLNVGDTTVVYLIIEQKEID